MYSILFDILISPEHQESFIELLWELQTLGIEESQLEEVVRFKAYFEPSQSANELRERFEKQMRKRNLQCWQVKISLLQTSPEEWLERWKSGFHSFGVGKTFFIHPSWEKPCRRFPVNIQIEPGQAFGTGTHESTQLCLLGLDQLAPNACSMLDVGTGSGILSIAARQLNSKLKITAMDIDWLVLQMARENWERNNVNNIVPFAGEIRALAGTFELVIANLTLEILVQLAEELKRVTSKWLLISGFTEEQTPLIMDLFNPGCLFQMTALWARNGWHCLHFSRTELYATRPD